MVNNFKEQVDSILAFVSGDLFATIFSVYFLQEMHWLHPLFKLIMSFSLGIFGGLGGLFIKTLYSVVEPDIKRKLKQWLRK